MVEISLHGRLIIEPYGQASFPVVRLFRRNKDGVVEMGMIYSALQGRKDPFFAIFATRPGSPILTFHRACTIDQRAFPIAEKFYKKHGITYWAPSTAPSPKSS
jgi:hypothetical protein